VAVDRTERLLNLVLCLLGAERPVTRSLLHAAVPGYADAASDDAFERMFERDKEELRGMGVPIHTVVTSAGEVEGYRIDVGDYAMPELSFTAQEVTVLGLAARAWSDAALSAPATAALRKVEAVAGLRGDVPGTSWRDASRTPGESELPVLWEAIRTRHVVTFDYRALGDVEPTPREVHPWATVRWQGAWYLAGWNRRRQAERVYRLSRITGSVRLLPDNFDPVDPGDARALVQRLGQPEPEGVALIRLPGQAGASLRERGDEQPDGLITVSFTDGDQLISEVLASGGVVVEPAELRERTREHLRRVVERHRGDGVDA